MPWQNVVTTATRTGINSTTRQYLPDLSVNGGAIAHNPEEISDCIIFYMKEGAPAVTNGLLVTVHGTLNATPTVDGDYTTTPSLYFELLPALPDPFVASIQIPIGKLYKQRFGFLSLGAQTYEVSVQYRSNGVNV